MWSVVGLGNPGSRYAGTRHNVGWLVVDRLAARWSASPAEIRGGMRLAAARCADEPVILAEPLTYMNRSGIPTAALLRERGTDRLVVVHDDLDLDFGQLRLKRGGGSGGHKGLKSLDAELADRDYVRVRFGIGRPPEGVSTVDYVLARWTEAEREALPALIERAADAVQSILLRGLTAAQNDFNTRKNPTPPKPSPDPQPADGHYRSLPWIRCSLRSPPQE